jgi:hypothetical protein
MQGDGGIDLSGTWHLPDREISVSAQCKREKRRLGARALRELEGSVLHSSTQVGLVISYSHYSTAALNHARASPMPMVLSVLGMNCTFIAFTFYRVLHRVTWLTHVYLGAGKEGITFFQPNPSLTSLLPKLVVGSRFLPPAPTASGPKRLPVLMYDGNSIYKPPS